MNYHRCAICNRTNNYKTTERHADFTKGPFFEDKKDATKMICFDCRQQVSDSLAAFVESDVNTVSDLEYLDFFYGEMP